VSLANEIVQRSRPQARSERRDLGLPLPRGRGEEVSHGEKYAPDVAASSHETQADDYSQPVLAGDAPSDYERYLNTVELLALQKGPDEWVHRDELLFQVTHQSSELWLKLVASDTDEAVRLIEDGDISGALRLLDRASLATKFVIAHLDMLERMSPWEYQEIRKVLGHGSGFDSPGWNALRAVFPRLGQAFHRKRRDAGLSLADVYVRGREHEDLYRLAEAVLELDEQAQHWRMRHYQVVARVIGDKVVGTQGTPVELLGKLISKTSFPELWEVRNELTARSKLETQAAGGAPSES
jgi:tryptophan 2,3-dioxygenase